MNAEPPPALRALQETWHQALRCPCTLHENGAISATPETLPQQAVATLAGAQARARLGLYQELVARRLHLSLADDLLLTRHLLGDTACDDLIHRALVALPSQHWSLYQLAEALPHWVGAHVPSATPQLLQALTIDLACRRTICAPDAHRLPRETPDLATQERILTTPIQLHPSVQWVHEDWNLCLQRLCLGAGEPPPPLAATSAQWLLLRGRDQRLHGLQLQTQASHFLQQLQSGMCLAQLVTQHDGDPAFVAVMPQWLQQWNSAGLFVW